MAAASDGPTWATTGGVKTPMASVSSGVSALPLTSPVIASFTISGT